MPFLLNHVQKSFREALDEVYNLKKFLLRQHVMEYALETSDFRMKNEVSFFFLCTDNLQSNAILLIIFLFDMTLFLLFPFQFHFCTEDIPEEVSISYLV